MHYSGYSASIRYSEEDGFFVGRILGINDIVSFHGLSVGEMRQQFAIALDSYLSDCEEMGKEPERPYSGKLNLRLPPEFHKAIAFEAESTGQSINDVIVAALQKSYIDKDVAPRRRRSVKKIRPINMRITTKVK
jgi:Uncharacterized protein encoded in hypervariable junctions of pilus gene clusters